MVNEIRDEMDVPVDEGDDSVMDKLMPDYAGFLQKFRLMFAVESEHEIDSFIALGNATAKFAAWFLLHAPPGYQATRASMAGKPAF